MFRCSDCSKEYSEKPQFCDCGNIYFEEIPDEVKTEAEKSRQKIVTGQKKCDPVSIVIFIICIILSVLSLIFIGKDSKKTQIEPKPVKNTVNTPIPNIDKIWQEPKKEVVVKPAVKPESKPIKPKQKIEQKPKQKVQQPLKQKPKAQKTQKPQSAEIKKTQTVVKEPVIAKPPVVVKDAAVIQKELQDYKISLRNRISRDIDFISVIGDGSCIVSFKIDANGKLIDRKFIQTSDNDSLNHAVFSAVMKNPAYKNPPAGYKNEDLKLSVKIFGGQFVVILN